MKPYKVTKGFIEQKIGNTMTIFDTKKSVMYTFNDTAAVIFKRLKKGEGVEKIALYLQKHFDVREADAIKHTDELIAQLAKKGIISSK